MAIITLPVEALTLTLPRLNVIIYSPKPVAPDSRNHGRSRGAGGFMRVATATTASAADAARYLSTPSEYGVKLASASRVNTNAIDQKRMVTAA